MLSGKLSPVRYCLNVGTSRPTVACDRVSVFSSGPAFTAHVLKVSDPAMER